MEEDSREANKMIFYFTVWVKNSSKLIGAGIVWKITVKAFADLKIGLENKLDELSKTFKN